MKRFFMLGLLVFGAAAAAPAASAQAFRVSIGSKSGVSAHLSYGSYGNSHASYGTYGYRRSYGSRSRWVPGHYEDRRQQFWVPGEAERVWREPYYEYRSDGCGNTVKVLVRDGYWEVIQHPGHYEWRVVRTWVPGSYCSY